MIIVFTTYNHEFTESCLQLAHYFLLKIRVNLLFIKYQKIKIIVEFKYIKACTSISNVIIYKHDQ